MKLYLTVLLSFAFICCNSNKEQTPTISEISLPSSHSAFKFPAMYYSTVRESGENISPQQRMIIKTATITSEVELYDSAFARVQKLVTAKNGFVVSSEITSSEVNRKTGTIKVRVPSLLFDETLKEISALSSKVLSQSINGNDVTEEYFDVSARLENKKKIEQRYREILTSAKTVEDILSVEKYLGEIREEIERLEGRKRFLGDQTALSTINVNFQEPEAFAEYEGKGFWQKVAGGFRRGLTGFGDVLSFTIAFLIASIPVVALFGIIVFTLLKVTKKYRVVKNKS